MILRDFQLEDQETFYRLMREVGWRKPGDPEPDPRFEGGHLFVAEVEGAVEGLTMTAGGVMRHLADDLPFCSIAAVATGRAARRLGIAGRLTAHALATGVAEGALVAGLCMFEQGFYNKLGFGTGGYEHQVSFDPAQLRVGVCPRIPRRLSPEDVAEMHQARLRRRRGHGSLNLSAPWDTQWWVAQTQNGFGLGYNDGPAGAELSHYFWCGAESVEHGPYKILWMVYQTNEQLLELLGLLKGLGDQVHLVSLREPPGLQLQDLLDQPFRHHRVTEQGRFEVNAQAFAYWQIRICDMPGCLAETHLRCSPLRFNLELSDPIERYLGPTAPWRGTAGQYVVTLGSQSGAEPGSDAALPTLRASVNAFSRMWLGVLPASSLAVTDDLSGPPDLLEELDWALRLPAPHMDWEL